MIHDSVVDKNADIVVQKGKTSSFILGRTDMATCKFVSSEVFFSSEGHETSVAQRTSTSDSQIITPTINEAPGEYDYFTKYTIESIRGNYDIYSPKHRICVYSEIPEHKAFAVHKIDQTRSEKRTTSEEQYPESLLTWHTPGSDVFEYILPTDAVVNGEVRTPSPICPTFSPSLDALLKSDSMSCTARITCEIYNNGETSEWSYSQTIVIGKERLEKISKHIFYSVQLKFGKVEARLSDYYFNPNTNESIPSADYGNLSDDDKTNCKRMMKVNINVATWTGKYDLAKVKETFEIKGNCFNSDGKTPLTEEQTIDSSRIINPICHITEGMSITLRLRRGDTDELIASKEFSSQSLATKFSFPVITSGGSSIVDNPEHMDGDTILFDRLKTLQLRWNVGGTYASSTANGEPTFWTVIVFQIKRTDGTIASSSSDDERSKLLGQDPTSSNDDKDGSIEARNELKTLLENGYSYEMLTYETRNYVFKNKLLPVLNGDEIDVKIFGRYAEVSSQNSQPIEKNIKFKKSIEFDVIHVCLPTLPECQGLKVQPTICLSNCDKRPLDNTARYLVYRPETRVDIYFNNHDTLTTCDNNYLLDLNLDGLAYQAKYHSESNRYQFNVMLKLDKDFNRRKARGASQDAEEISSRPYAIQRREVPQGSLRGETQSGRSMFPIEYNGETVSVSATLTEIHGYVNQYEYNIMNNMPSVYKCYIPIPSPPSLRKSKQYFFPKAEIPIEFRQSRDLYNDCIISETKTFTGYFMKYWMVDAEEETAKNFTDIIPATKEANDVKTFTIPNTMNIEPGIYNYRVVAFNFVNETGQSAVGTFQICTSTSDEGLSGLKPKLVSPQKEFPASIQDLVFTWETPMKLRALRCSTEEDHTIVLTVSKRVKSKDGARRGLTEVISRELPPATQSYRLSSVLLDLSADYTWKVTVRYTDTEKNERTFESDEAEFTTVAKHCARMDCGHGVCDEVTTKCKCFEGYSGEACTKSAVRIGAIVGAIAGLIGVIVVIAIVVFLGIKQGMKYKLGKPKFQNFRFTMPESIDTMGAVPSSSQTIEEKLACDPENNFEWAIAMLTTAKGDDVTELCRALVYAFERHGHGLDLLLRLVDYEIDKAEFVNTLFRNNSFATKCFYVYSHLIGLDYLYNLTAPLLQKLLRDQEKNNMQIAVTHQHSRFEDVDFEEQNQVGYELNPVLIDDVQDEDYILTNALSVQLSCQVFISTLSKNNLNCPHEFIRLCNHIKARFKEKFPDSNPDHALSAFMFLRFIIAGLSTPKECGFIATQPCDEIRRQLVLISKVLSMWSIGAIFDEKEEYMIVMNDFIEGHAGALAKYYEFVTSDSEKSQRLVPVEIPQKYYEASIEILGSMDGLINRNSKKQRKPKKEHDKKDAKSQANRTSRHHHHHHHHICKKGDKKEQRQEESETPNNRESDKNVKTRLPKISETSQPTESVKEDYTTDDELETRKVSETETSDALNNASQNGEAEQVGSAGSSIQDEAGEMNESQLQSDKTSQQDTESTNRDSTSTDESDESVQQSDDESVQQFESDETVQSDEDNSLSNNQEVLIADAKDTVQPDNEE